IAEFIQALRSFAPADSVRVVERISRMSFPSRPPPLPVSATYASAGPGNVPYASASPGGMGYPGAGPGSVPYASASPGGRGSPSAGPGRVPYAGASPGSMGYASANPASHNPASVNQALRVPPSAPSKAAAPTGMSSAWMAGVAV